MGEHEGTVQIEYDDVNMKTKFFLTRFGGTFGTLRFDQKLFLKKNIIGFCSILGLQAYQCSSC